MAVQILNDELAHEQDIEDWLRDIERLKEDIRAIRLKTACELLQNCYGT